MTTKICSLCKNEKDLNDFHKSKSRGVQNYCKFCSSKKRNEWIQNNRDKTKLNRLWSRYRLRESDYLQMIENQNNKCLICLKELIKPHIDHSHKSDKVRGILCQDCNHLVGWIENNIELLPIVLEYISKEEQPVGESNPDFRHEKAAS